MIINTTIAGSGGGGVSTAHIYAMIPQYAGGLFYTDAADMTVKEPEQGTPFYTIDADAPIGSLIADLYGNTLLDSSGFTLIEKHSPASVYEVTG